MTRRLVVLCHLIPSVSPWNVYDLAWSDWLQFAGFVDGWIASRQKGNTGG